MSLSRSPHHRSPSLELWANRPHIMRRTQSPHLLPALRSFVGEVALATADEKAAQAGDRCGRQWGCLFVWSQGGVWPSRPVLVASMRIARHLVRPRRAGENRPATILIFMCARRTWSLCTSVGCGHDGGVPHARFGYRTVVWFKLHRPTKCWLLACFLGLCLMRLFAGSVSEIETPLCGSPAGVYGNDGRGGRSLGQRPPGRELAARAWRSAALHHASPCDSRRSGSAAS